MCKECLEPQRVREEAVGWGGAARDSPKAGSGFNILKGFMLALTCMHVTHSEETDKIKF